LKVTDFFGESWREGERIEDFVGELGGAMLKEVCSVKAGMEVCLPRAEVFIRNCGEVKAAGDCSVVVSKDVFLPSAGVVRRNCGRTESSERCFRGDAWYAAIGVGDAAGISSTFAACCVG